MYICIAEHCAMLCTLPVNQPASITEDLKEAVTEPRRRGGHKAKGQPCNLNQQHIARIP